MEYRLLPSLTHGVDVPMGSSAYAVSIAKPAGSTLGAVGAAPDAGSATNTLAGSWPVLLTTVIFHGEGVPAAATPVSAASPTSVAAEKAATAVRRRGKGFMPLRYPSPRNDAVPVPSRPPERASSSPWPRAP